MTWIIYFKLLLENNKIYQQNANKITLTLISPKYQEIAPFYKLPPKTTFLNKIISVKISHSYIGSLYFTQYMIEMKYNAALHLKIWNFRRFPRFSSDCEACS